jgi:ribosomal protein L11 methyltransferase
VRLAAEKAEAARAVMLDLFPEGFEEVEAGGEVELAAYTRPGGEESVWRAFGRGAVCEVAPGWADAWRAFHRPVRVGPLWIGPPWDPPDEEAVAVVIDPGRAFGTGAHATTRLCLELVLEISSRPPAPERAYDQPASFLDLGCGSGVLAIAAAKLGFTPVVAIDSDEAAVEAARVNAATNAVDVAVRRADVLADPLPQAEAAAANITRADAERLAARVGSQALIMSGYLKAERPAPPGWRHLRRREAEGWAADLFVRL